MGRFPPKGQALVRRFLLAEVLGPPRARTGPHRPPRQAPQGPARPPPQDGSVRDDPPRDPTADEEG